MKTVGILSDTHSLWDERYRTHFSGCDEIWHVGDIGSLEVVEKLREVAPLRAVYGNIDGQPLRQMFPQTQEFTLDGVSVMFRHVGGWPGHYAPGVKALLAEKRPMVFLSGHSHILKAMYDEKLSLLHLNPGAAGRQGWQKQRTLMRLRIDGGKIVDLEVIELS